MKPVGKNLCIIALIICVSICGGCNFLETMVSDVGGWDFSACVDGFGTCWEFYFDNADNLGNDPSAITGDLPGGVK